MHTAVLVLFRSCFKLLIIALPSCHHLTSRVELPRHRYTSIMLQAAINWSTGDRNCWTILSVFFLPQSSVSIKHRAKYNKLTRLTFSFDQNLEMNHFEGRQWKPEHHPKSTYFLAPVEIDRSQYLAINTENLYLDEIKFHPWSIRLQLSFIQSVSSV